MDEAKEFIRYLDGRCIVMEADDIIWSSDDDESFQDKFGEFITPDQIDEVLTYLADTDVLDEDEAIDVTDESDPDVETIGNDLAGEFDDGDDLEETVH